MNNMNTDTFIEKCEQASDYNELRPLYSEIETLNPVLECKLGHYTKGQILKNLAWYHSAWYHLIMKNKALEEEILVLNKKLESEKDANDYLTRENFDRL